MPTGMVPRISSQASFWSVFCGSQRLVPGSGAATCLTEAKNATMIRIQSRQKKMIMAMAVATCSPTMNARYADFDPDTLRSVAHCPPTSAGMRMAWPRLDTGNSSVTPWMRPMIPASPYVKCDMPALRFPADPSRPG